VPDAQRITIASRAGDPADTDVAARTSHVLDDDRLPERGPHALAEEARNRVGRPAGGIRHDHREGTRGIGLGPRDPRHDRKRCSARCQLENLTTREFHSVRLRDAVAEISPLLTDRDTPDNAASIGLVEASDPQHQEVVASLLGR
jgi:hypothetical protein